MATNHFNISPEAAASTSDTEAFVDAQAWIAPMASQPAPVAELSTLDIADITTAYTCIVKQLPELADRDNIYDFTQNIESQILEAMDLAWIIQTPTSKLAPQQKHLSRQITLSVRAKIRSQISNTGFPIHFYEFFHHLKELTPDVPFGNLDYIRQLSKTRPANQSFADYAEDFFPICLRVTRLSNYNEEASKVIPLLATLLWLNHSPHYTNAATNEWFKDNVRSWKTLNDVVNAFRDKTSIDPPKASLLSKNQQRPKLKGNQTSRKFNRAKSKSGPSTGTNGSKQSKDKSNISGTVNVQRYGIDYEETYSEVVSIENVLLGLSLAVQRDWTIDQIDIKSAYLYRDLKEIVYRKQPEGYSDGNRVGRLKKALYGLKQAPREWYHTFANFLLSIDFEHVSEAYGTFFRRKNNVPTLLVVYVDDILIMSSNPEESEQIKKEIKTRFELSDSGSLESYLSLHIEKTKNGYSLDAHKNINKLLQDFKGEIESAKFRSTPPILPKDARLATSIELKLENGEELSSREKAYAQPISEVKHHKFRSAVGMFNYLVTRCRPDIAFATSQLSRYTNKPNKLHWSMLLRLLIYISRNSDARLLFEKQKEPKLVGFTDATYCSDQVRHTHGGFLWKYGNCLVHWESRRERHACRSIHEAELRCLANALEYGMTLKDTLCQIGEMTHDEECILYTDSQSSSHVVNNEKYSNATRRYRIHLDYIIQNCKEQNLRVIHCPGGANEADILTKPLSQANARKSSEAILSFC